MWHSLASSSKYLEALERELIESDNYTLLCRVISETKAAVSSETDRDCACIKALEVTQRKLPNMNP
jgi:hypothetical protein